MLTDCQKTSTPLTPGQLKLATQNIQGHGESEHRLKRSHNFSTRTLLVTSSLHAECRRCNRDEIAQTETTSTWPLHPWSLSGSAAMSSGTSSLRVNTPSSCRLLDTLRIVQKCLRSAEALQDRSAACWFRCWLLSPSKNKKQYGCLRWLTIEFYLDSKRHSGADGFSISFVPGKEQ